MFTRSAVEERSITPPDEFDRYLVESFRPVTKALLPATTTPYREVAPPKAATTGAAMTSRVVVVSADIVPRRLRYSDVSKMTPPLSPHLTALQPPRSGRIVT
jgi:hypothetical protein